MDEKRREFLDALLSTPTPSGFEAPGQRVWIEYVSAFADEVRTDEYGNAVAVVEGSGPAIAFAGHADEIGFIVRAVDDDGFLRLGRIGGTDRTVSRGQHVEVHSDEGPVSGVIGQTAIHLREPEDEELPDVEEQYVDVGAAGEAEARELVSVGDPVTVATGARDLHGTRVAARGADNRVGVWAAAEGLRRAAEAGADATVYAVSTVQEEIGHHGARMVGFDLDLDAVVVVDVSHAVDTPGLPPGTHGEVEMGDGPVICRGSTNHPVLVEAARSAVEGAGIEVQLSAAGSSTHTDAEGFVSQRGGVPTMALGVPTRYMHTPVETVDTGDLDAAADALAVLAAAVEGYDSFAVHS